jgi:F-type H+-transporting ATPase subunit b
VLIDWVTVGAQVLNFVILVWLMKRFLYKPVLRAIAERETLIAAQIADAVEQDTRARKEKADYEHKNEVFDHQRAQLLSKANADAAAERKRLLEAARVEADALTAKRKSSLTLDARELNQEVAQQIRAEVFAITRRVLSDLAGTSLEAAMTDAFATKLRAINGEARNELGLAHATGTSPALVHSAFDLDGSQQDVIRTALNETFSTEIPVRFEVEPSLLGGIELSSGGQKIAWSVDDYLGSLEKGIAILLGEVGKPQAGTTVEQPIPGGTHEQHI